MRILRIRPKEFPCGHVATAVYVKFLYDFLERKYEKGWYHCEFYDAEGKAIPNSFRQWEVTGLEMIAPADTNGIWDEEVYITTSNNHKPVLAANLMDTLGIVLDTENYANPEEIDDDADFSSTVRVLLFPTTNSKS